VQTAVYSGDSSYTGCDKAVSGSDDRVRKMTERTREPSLSNQIHNAQEND
jgi:hypothetical protein